MCVITVMRLLSEKERSKSCCVWLLIKAGLRLFIYCQNRIIEKTSITGLV